MAITKEDVRKVARLARIRVDENAEEECITFLNNIVPIMDKLSAVDTTNVEPTTSVSGATMLMRDDNEVKKDSHEDVMANAREQYGYFTVPKVIE